MFVVKTKSGADTDIARAKMFIIYHHTSLLAYYLDFMSHFHRVCCKRSSKMHQLSRQMEARVWGKVRSPDLIKFWFLTLRTSSTFIELKTRFC